MIIINMAQVEAGVEAAFLKGVPVATLAQREVAYIRHQMDPHPSANLFRDVIEDFVYKIEADFDYEDEIGIPHRNGFIDLRSELAASRRREVARGPHSHRAATHIRRGTRWEINLNRFEATREKLARLSALERREEREFSVEQVVNPETDTL